MSKSTRPISFVLLLLAAVGIVLSLIGAPGWMTALLFAALIIGGALTMRRTSRVSPGDLPPPVRRDEPDTYRAIEWKGMIFRSNSEVKIAKTLDHRGIFFVPPARVRMSAGKADRQTRELDFIICYNGKWGVLEVDGPYHDRKLDAQRDSLLRSHGIKNIQRFPSGRCYEQPQAVIDEFLRNL